jgi:hypothetical protein
LNSAKLRAARRERLVGPVDLLEGAHAGGDEHRLAQTRDPDERRDVGHLAGADLEGVDPEGVELLRRLPAERRAQVLDADRAAVRLQLRVLVDREGVLQQELVQRHVEVGRHRDVGQHLLVR